MAEPNIKVGGAIMAMLLAMGSLCLIAGILGLTGEWQFADPINLRTYSVWLIKQVITIHGYTI